MFSLLYLEVKVQLYFVRFSCMFVDKKILLKIWLNPGLNLGCEAAQCSRSSASVVIVVRFIFCLKRPPLWLMGYLCDRIIS